MSERTVIHGGRGRVFLRGETYYAQIRVGPNKYIDRSLRTKDKAAAIRAAEKLCYEVEFKQQHSIPINVKKFSDVLNEYVAFREKQYKQGHTKWDNLRQMIRVSKFWHAYAGNKTITSVNDSVLGDYIEWRNEFYENIPEADRPRNYKLNPTDKTLQWEITYVKTVIKWAQSKGYRGKEPLPSFTFSPKKRRVRPAFEPDELRQLWIALDRWIAECKDKRLLHTRELLRDYVAVLVYSGMRVGEANNLQVRDVLQITDSAGRINYSFKVSGKTGEREVIPRIEIAPYLESLLGRHENPVSTSWLFAMKGGQKIITLIDQFDKVLELGKIQRSRLGLKFSLYSLRHTYAINALRDDVSVYTIATNMGTGVPIIQDYYGRQATPRSMATTLGGVVDYDIINGKRIAKGSKPDKKTLARQLQMMNKMMLAEATAHNKNLNEEKTDTINDATDNVADKTVRTHLSKKKRTSNRNIKRD